jgi:exonuclease III
VGDGMEYSILDLDFAIQNCNSLNVSLSSEKQSKKVAAIIAISAGIIFLSDIRLNADQGSSRSNLFKNCSNRSYSFWHNSSKSKRGVGILIASDLNIQIIDSYRDNDHNVLGLLVDTGTTNMLLVSVYGPNNNDLSFFNFLHNLFMSHSGIPVICGGDWNLTFSTDPSINNIDILNMNAPPSHIRSNKLHELCEGFHLTDPYRVLYPSRREYTYIPRAQTTNRSRIDFFLVSENLLNRLEDCRIKSNLLSSLFDHKCVTLSLFKKKKNQ